MTTRIKVPLDSWLPKEGRTLGNTPSEREVNARLEEFRATIKMRYKEMFLRGEIIGEFQVDGKVFPIAEGSVVRVAPAAKRTLRNTGNEPLTMICVQYKVDSFTADDAHDGDILSEAIVW